MKITLNELNWFMGRLRWLLLPLLATVFFCCTDNSYKSNLGSKQFTYGINLDGDTLFKAIGKADRYMNDNLAPIMHDSTFGFINRKGELAIDYKYQQTSPYVNGLAAVKKEDKWGYIDSTGKTVIDFQFNFATMFFNQRATVSISENYGVINKQGDFVINPRYDMILPKGDNYIVRDSDGWYIINEEGNKILKNKYVAISDIDGEIIAVKPFNKDFYEISESLFNEYLRTEDLNPDDFVDQVRIKGLKTRGANFKNVEWGLINHQGEFICKPTYSKIKSIAKGRILAKKENGWGVIDESCNTLIDFQFDYLSGFSNSKVAVAGVGDEKTKYGLINAEGEFVINPIYDSIKLLSQDLFLVEKEGQWGYFNREGKKVIDFKFNHAGPFVDGVALVY